METNRRLAELLLGLVPEDGGAIGNPDLKHSSWPPPRPPV